MDDSRGKRRTRREITEAWNREHYTQIKISVNKSIAEAYKRRCRELGIPYARALKQAIGDVIEGRMDVK